MPRYKNLWEEGDKAKLARLADISPQYLNDILHARCAAGKETAINLVDAAAQLNYKISLLDVLYPEDSANPLIGA